MCIAIYVASISTLSFAFGIDDTCGAKVHIAADSVAVALHESNTLFRVSKGNCDVYSGANKSVACTRILDRAVSSAPCF